MGQHVCTNFPKEGLLTFQRTFSMMLTDGQQCQIDQKAMPSSDSLCPVWSLELEFLAFEGNIVKAPCLGGQRGAVAHFTFLYKKSQIDCTTVQT